MKPIQELSEWLEDPVDAPDQPYNYNFYIVFGKKLINYADFLAQQSVIPLAPSALGELDFFSRRMAQSLVRLYEAGGRGEHRFDASRYGVNGARPALTPL